jgi:DNA ligase (NAD+)
VERPEGEAMLYCPNSACPARIYWGLVHFVSRGAMDIRGLGERTIATLLERGMVTDVSDIYTLTEEQLLTLEGFKEKSAQNLLAGIADSKKQGLARVLFGLGVRHVGEIAAQTLARHFGSMERLMAASVEEIEAVHTIGHTMAAALHAWMAEPRNQEVVRKLAAAGVDMTEERAEPAEGPFTGRTFVITGTHPTMSRPQMEAFIQQHGGRVTGSVTKKTDYLVVGEDAGSKLAKAQELGIKQLSEAGLLALPALLDASSAGAEAAESTEASPDEPLQPELQL